MASLNFLRSSSSLATRARSLASSALRSSSIRCCSASTRLFSSSIASLLAFSVAASPKALVKLLRALNALSRNSSKATLVTTFCNSGTKSGPKGATASGVSTNLDMLAITIQAARLSMARFSFKPRLRTGHKIAKVEASTGATNVVAMSSCNALTVSLGLQTAVTTDGIAGKTSGFEFVEQIANKQSPAALLTCGLVSHTCAVTKGIRVGNNLDTCLGAVVAHCPIRSKTLYLTLHSDEYKD
mmetsp:Transcript_8405/g.12893  ORF Transcript_8405/g.12893 Transcript_8405/m.12893 type:complete len:242 (-) Transcript_8405:384-1109(-)